MRGTRAVQVLAGAVLAALLAGCESGPPPDAADRDVVRPALRFAVDVPEGWTWNDLAGDVVLEMVRRTPPENEPASGADEAGSDAEADRRRPRRTRPVIHVAVLERDGLSLEAWADEAVTSSQDLQADLELVEREPASLASGRPALDLVLKNPRGLEPFVQRLRLTVTDRRAYAVIATAPASRMDEVGDAVTRCFDSFVVW